MVTVGNSWQHLAREGNSWQQLATVGNSWQQLAIVGNSWQQLAIVGNSWQQLATVGNSWHQLATVGNSWQRLATVGNNLLTFLCALQPTQFQSKYTHIIFKRSFLFVFCFFFLFLGPPPPKVQLCDEQKIKWAWPYRKVKYLHLRCCVCTIAKNLITIRIELYSNSFFPFYWCNRIKLIFEMQKKISKKTFLQQFERFLGG